MENTPKTFAEAAKEFIKKQTLVISDIESFNPFELEIKEKTAIDNKGEDFTYEYVVIDGINYRVPISVKEQLKTYIEQRPKTKNYKVIKNGAGDQTRYQVMPLD